MIAILPHLGLGDQIITSGMLKEKFKDGTPFMVACRKEHKESMCDMYGGVDHANVIGCDTDEAAFQWFLFVKQSRRIGLGQWCEHTTFDASKFVEEFARQLGVPVESSWERYSVMEPPGDYFIDPLEGDFVFVHDCPERGIEIAKEALPNMPVYRPRPPFKKGLIAHTPAIVSAKEIHVVDSSFLNHIDRVAPESRHVLDGKLFLHAYAKQPANLPLLKCKWHIYSTKPSLTI